MRLSDTRRDDGKWLLHTRLVVEERRKRSFLPMPEGRGFPNAIPMNDEDQARVLEYTFAYAKMDALRKSAAEAQQIVLRLWQNVPDRLKKTLQPPPETPS